MVVVVVTRAVDNNEHVECDEHDGPTVQTPLLGHIDNNYEGVAITEPDIQFDMGVNTDRDIILSGSSDEESLTSWTDADIEWGAFAQVN